MRHGDIAAFAAVVAAAALALRASVALAGTPPQESIALDWRDCPLSANAVSDLTTACGDGATEQLVASFTLAQAVDSVLAVDVTIDLVSQNTTLPAWWHYEPAGCRYGKLSASADFTAYTACTDFWQGQATFDTPPVYELGLPRGGTNQARIEASMAVLSSAPRALAAGTHYYAVRLAIANDAASPCAGCTVPTCLVLNAIRLVRPGTVAGDVLLLQPAPSFGNEASWQGPGAACSTVPVRRTTWGELHTLYR